MATARKSTETVYTLELSEAERKSLADLLYAEGCGAEHTAVYLALADASPETTAPPPLAVGDRVRVVGRYVEAHSKNIVAPPGEFMVGRATPDSDNELWVYAEAGDEFWYLPSNGEGTVWERI